MKLDEIFGYSVEQVGHGNLLNENALLKLKSRVFEFDTIS